MVSLCIPDQFQHNFRGFIRGDEHINGVLISSYKRPDQQVSFEIIGSERSSFQRSRKLPDKMQQANHEKVDRLGAASIKTVPQPLLNSKGEVLNRIDHSVVILENPQKLERAMQAFGWPQKEVINKVMEGAKGEAAHNKKSEDLYAQGQEKLKNNLVLP
jgi:hypothetical protein